MFGFSAGGLFSDLGDIGVGELSGERGGQVEFGEAPDGTPVVPAGVLEDRPLDLRTEEGGMHGGHTVNRHVAKPPDELKNRLIESRKILFDTDRIRITSQIVEPMGSFSTLSDANRFVQETVETNAAEIKAALVNRVPRLMVESRFGYSTGYEAYSETHDAAPRIRETYAVRVILRLDPVTQRDYRVLTAFPIHQVRSR